MLDDFMRANSLLRKSNIVSWFQKTGGMSGFFCFFFASALCPMSPVTPRVDRSQHAASFPASTPVLVPEKSIFKSQEEERLHPKGLQIPGLPGRNPDSRANCCVTFSPIPHLSVL